MQTASESIVKDLVLVGGGHSHCIALRMFGMKALPGVRLTLITETSHTPYSGMLPGHIAGFYDFDESHIDLRPLAQFAQAQLYIDTVVGLDLENNKVICANRPDVAFDILSIDIGSTPATVSVPGAAEYAIPVKPVQKFLAHWERLVDCVTQKPEKPITLGIVGGGAGGVELALTMQSRLHQVLADFWQQTPRTPLYQGVKIHIFHSGAELMPTYNRWVRRHFEKILSERSIQLHLGETVSVVQPHRVKCESGKTIECDRVFWVTQASAPSWIKASGLATDSKGFIQTGDTLQSVSHPHVFAAGDIATMLNHPRPKAGVFAVRQGKPLYKNLRRALLGGATEGLPLQPYIPQKQYLSLIGTGNGSAIASWGPFGWESPLFWRWKDYIDRQFMRRFTDLPEMRQEGKGKLPTSELNTQMHCGGCGAKVGSSTLQQVLQRLQLEHLNWANNSDILIGLGTPDDAAVVRVPPGEVMVHTLDYFRALINDPFIFGQITTNHCLSDIFAMGATPQSALAIVTIPYGLAEKQAETLYQLLAGATKVLNKSQTPLVGGHTTEGAELVFGLSCNGLADPDRLLRKGGMKPEQVLILTKALGTGTLFAAEMRCKAKGRWIDGAVHSMLLSNQEAAACLLQHQASACTDITGFGLLGHLLEMIQSSGVAVELDLEAIPVLDGAIETMQMGIASSLQPQNLHASRQISNVSEASNNPKYPLLFDPQTAGGLLAAIPAEQADSCLASLKALGYKHSCIIGCVTSLVENRFPITAVLS